MQAADNTLSSSLLMELLHFLYIFKHSFDKRVRLTVASVVLKTLTRDVSDPDSSSLTE